MSVITIEIPVQYVETPEQPDRPGYRSNLVIYIGRQGETGARKVAFDVAGMIEQYGAGTVTLLHQRSGDPAPYIVSEAAVTAQNHVVDWVVDDTDTLYSGAGLLELRLSFGEDDSLAKSALYTTITNRALAEEIEVPGNVEPWYDAMIDYFKSHSSSGGSGMSEDVIDALLNCFAHVAWVDDQGQTYYEELDTALHDIYWSVTNTLSHCTTSDSAEHVLKGDPYTATITASAGYTLTGATVSVTMGGTDITSTAYDSGTISIDSVTGALVISVTAAALPVELVSIDATYTQSGTVYDNASLDSLKADLVVTATYDDTSSATVAAADYTLSGTLTEGTSTITVTYEGKTDTFNVTVTEYSVTLDTVVYENKSYRDIFITGNQLQGFGFENGLPSGCTTNSGSPSISTDDAYGGTHSVKAFGSTSQQYKSVNTSGVADWNRYSGKVYFNAYKAKVTRYTKGNIGVSIAAFHSGPTAVTDGWKTYAKYTNATGASAGSAYIGSRTSADLDGYVDDIVMINLTDLFTTLPSESDITQWYNDYCDILKAGGE